MLVVVIAGLVSPAELHDMIGGQNGALTGGLLVTALLLFERRPVFGGVVSGLLLIKPQIALALPAVLLRRRMVTPLCVCAGTAFVLALASLAIEGWQSWVWFFSVAAPAFTKAAAAPFSAFFPAAGITVFSMARSLQASVSAAWMLQWTSSFMALGSIWLAWRVPQRDALARMALTCSLAVLAMPHGFAYDLVAFSIGMAALFARAAGWWRLPCGLLWLTGGYTITIANLTGLLLFPVFAFLGALLAWRLMIVPAISDHNGQALGGLVNHKPTLCL